ncbi:hypothetical protein LQ954_15755 [Sphingomonas sp. IC-11]|uniref:hypothetical protein n=1 Tax=Sphingomonas sp. IC-11 TaxID=2898528 RepID=UPI001E330534|nr:hypothetical protein [Sphingomonas sp. IC-11]MCD2317604.1 hypothetical protein [Sphingomonas sp. IC-11]
MADGDIVVIANPQSPPATEIPVPNPGPGDPATAAVRQNAQFIQQVLKSESDVTGDDIVVVGKRFIDTALKLATATTFVRNSGISVPCLGDNIYLRGPMLALRFNLTNKTFGPGRAGANYASGGSTSPVDINAADFKSYMAYGEGGAGYLITHEMAHTFKSMRDFNAAKFSEFRSGAGAGLSLDEAKAAFANTPGFIEVEARANTIARAIYNKLSDGKDYGFTPTNGYGTC